MSGFLGFLIGITAGWLIASESVKAKAFRSLLKSGAIQFRDELARQIKRALGRGSK